jgi:hypothetical protein
MTVRDEQARAEIRARLAVSREELLRLLDPPRQASDANGNAGAAYGSGGFPRSRTMKVLMGSRGLGILGAVAGGLFIARPALALRLLRMLPSGAVGRMLLMKAISALRAKRD